MSPQLIIILGLLLGCLITALKILARPLFSPRALWFLLVCFLALSTGITVKHQGIALLGLVPILWFLWEWLLFSLRIRLVIPKIQINRFLSDHNGPVRILWSDQPYCVEVTVSIPEPDTGIFGQYLSLAKLPFLKLADQFPKNLHSVPDSKQLQVIGSLSAEQPLVFKYRIMAGRLGIVRFEGIRLDLADYQGFFYHRTFLRDPFLITVLPRLSSYTSLNRNKKRHNELPPPGQQRLLLPGSGSELLDLRDYLPGDPPRTIAWKVSARKDRLITKEFESDVPIRCTLLVDTSKSVLLPTRAGTPLQHLVAIAASVIRSNASRRDLTGLIVFGENTSSYHRPERSSSHVQNLIKSLADLASQKPSSCHINPDLLLPLAYNFAREIYPDQLSSTRNAMPWWLQWMDAFPGHWRHPVGFLRSFYRHKLELLWFALVTLPFFFVFANLLAGYWLPEESKSTLVGLSATATFLFGSVSIVLFLLSSLISFKQRRLGLWRKRLAALFSINNNLDPGGLALFLEDDAAFSLNMQHFLGEHQVAYDLPLYSEQGKYLFLAPEKIPVVTRALIQAVSRSKDNELFVVFADLLELEDHLQPLIHAIRMALARHHQILIVCSWPPSFPEPGSYHPQDLMSVNPAKSSKFGSMSYSISSYLSSYHRVQKQFRAIGVAMLCPAQGDPLPAILERMDRLRKSQQIR